MRPIARVGGLAPLVWSGTRWTAGCLDQSGSAIRGLAVPLTQGPDMP